MNKNLGIVLVLIGMIVVIIIGGFLVMQMSPANINTSKNLQKTGNQQTNTPSTTNGNNITTISTPKTYDVEIKNFAFSPSTLTIKKNDIVRWMNQDSVAHTIVSDSGNEINSPSLSTGEAYSKTFENSGIYTYHCGIHPSMKGEIIVE